MDDEKGVPIAELLAVLRARKAGKVVPALVAAEDDVETRQLTEDINPWAGLNPIQLAEAAAAKMGEMDEALLVAATSRRKPGGRPAKAPKAAAAAAPGKKKGRPLGSKNTPKEGKGKSQAIVLDSSSGSSSSEESVEGESEEEGKSDVESESEEELVAPKAVVKAVALKLRKVVKSCRSATCRCK